jgi:hypothetical protein
MGDDLAGLNRRPCDEGRVDRAQPGRDLRDKGVDRENASFGDLHSIQLSYIVDRGELHIERCVFEADAGLAKHLQDLRL